MPEENAAPARTPKELAPPSPSLLEEASSPAASCLQKAPPPAPGDSTSDVVAAAVSTTTISPLVLKIIEFETSEYREDNLNAELLAQAVSCSNPHYAEKLRSKVQKGRSVSEFGSYSVAEKNPPSYRFSPPSNGRR